MYIEVFSVLHKLAFVFSVHILRAPCTHVDVLASKTLTRSVYFCHDQTIVKNVVSLFAVTIGNNSFAFILIIFFLPADGF